MPPDPLELCRYYGLPPSLKFGYATAFDLIALFITNRKDKQKKLMTQSSFRRLFISDPRVSKDRNCPVPITSHQWQFNSVYWFVIRVSCLQNDKIGHIVVACFCLRSKHQTLLTVSAVHQPFYISICIWTLPSLKTLDFTFYIGSTPTFLYFNLYLNTAFARNVRLYFLFRQYTNLFIFWFVSIDLFHKWRLLHGN